MSLPSLWICSQTSTAVQVREAFSKALAPELFAEIDEVSCGYELLSDSVQFMIKRKRDGMKVILPVERRRLTDAEPDVAVNALRADQEAFASLILFLA